MESVHGTHKASKFASEDVISRMPENVITNILDRLPIQDAVKTSILSRNWRFCWTMLTQVVFDFQFFECLSRTKEVHLFYSRNLGRVLLHLKGLITKFVLYIPNEEYNVMDAEDINHWILFLSTKGVKELVLMNMGKTPLKLPSHIFSFQELRHLKLYNCCFRTVPRFHGFPNLLSLDFHQVRFESCKYGEFILQCPLLEILTITHHIRNGEEKPVEIAKLGNLKKLSLSLRKWKFDNVAITSSEIFELMCSLPKLEELDLDFRKCKFLAEDGGRKRVIPTLPCLKILALAGIDFNSYMMVLCACDLIHGSPNLQTLEMVGTHVNHVVQHPLDSWEVECGIIMGKLQQLQNVELECMRGLEIEVCLIKSLLAYSPLLKRMVVNQRTAGLFAGSHENYMFARKLLKLHRASPVAEIHLY